MAWSRSGHGDPGKEVPGRKKWYDLLLRTDRKTVHSEKLNKDIIKVLDPKRQTKIN